MDLNLVTRQLSLQLNRQALEKLSLKPATPLLLIEGITNEEVVNWLESKHSQEFARFSIKDDEDKREVAEWFIRNIRDFYTYRATQYRPE